MPPPSPRLLARPPSHVLFDLDGTLLDTEPLYTQATQAVVGRFGHVFDWSIKRRMMGGHPRHGAALLIEALALPLSVDEFLHERDLLLLELFQRVPPMPGAAELVEALAAARVPLAVATSSERALCELKLGAHAFAERFSAVVCVDDPGVGAAKPAPDLFLSAARALCAEPAACLVIEDTPLGVQAARAAGMQVIVVPDPQLRDAAFDGAAACLSSLTQVSLAALGL